MKIKKAIIAVAGFGTRFLPATKAQPKEMLPIVDKPVVQFIVEEVVKSGIKDIVFVTGRGKHAIENHFDYSVELENALRKGGKQHLYEKIKKISDMASFAYVRQKETKGNGDALLCASHMVGGETCAVLFGDDLVDSKKPVIKQLAEVYEKYNASVVALDMVPPKETHKYGIVKAKKIEGNLYIIEDIVEKPANPKDAPSNLAVVGKYIITPEVFEILEKLKKSPKWKKSKKELGITDAFKELLKTRPLYGVLFEGTRYDCGSKIGFLKAIVDHALKHPEVKEEFGKYLKTKKI